MKGASGPIGRANHWNVLLDSLRPDELDALKARIEEREFRAGDVLHHPGDRVEAVYFPCGPALVSIIVALEDGREVNALSVGREGALGSLTGMPQSAYARAIVKSAGPIAKVPVGVLEAAKTRSAAFREIFSRYVDCLITQTLQSIACNAVHSIEERAAKWILKRLDLVDGDTILLTQRELAAMLGVGRSYANRITQSLRAQGILSARRSMIVVRDRAALESKACKCDRWVKEHCDGAP